MLHAGKVLIMDNKIENLKTKINELREEIENIKSVNKTIIIEKDKTSALSWHNYFNAIHWLIRARNIQNDTRIALKMIYVEDGFMCCTDGHRLHVYAPDYEELPAECLLSNGLYEVKTANKKQIILTWNDEGWSFPDYWKILNYRPIDNLKSKHFGINSKKIQRNDKDVKALMNSLNNGINTKKKFITCQFCSTINCLWFSSIFLIIISKFDFFLLFNNF